MENNMNALDTVREALPVFRDLNDLQNAYNSMNRRLEALRSQRISHAKKSSSLLGVLAGGASYAALRFLFAALSKAAPFFGSAIFSLISLGVGIGLLVLVNNRVMEKRNVVSNEETSAGRQIVQITQTIDGLVESNRTVIECIPRDYRHYDALVFFENALINGRADSLKEVMAQYEEHLHRMRLERDSQEMLEKQRQQSAQLSNIENASRRSAANSGVAATFSVLNFLNNL